MRSLPLTFLLIQLELFCNSLFHSVVYVYQELPIFRKYRCTNMDLISSAKFVSKPRNCFPFFVYPRTSLPEATKILSLVVPGEHKNNQLKQIRYSFTQLHNIKDTYPKLHQDRVCLLLSQVQF